MTHGGYGDSLEWATSCPPPRHNVTKIPRIRSGRPAFGLRYPHIQTGRTRRPVPPVSTPAFCVSIVAVMRLRFAIRRGQPGACRAPSRQERGAGTSLRVKPSCSWERTKALR
jgi:hypothetical protein